MSDESASPAGVMVGARRLIAPTARKLVQRLDNPEIRAARHLVSRARSGPLDVVHFGASESVLVSPEDTDRRTVGAMLADVLKPESVYSLAGAGYHPRLMSEYLRLLTAHRTPRVLVFALLVRVGYIPWVSHPLYAYERAQRSLRRLNPQTHPALIRRSLPLPTQAQMDELDRIEFPTLIGTRSVGDYRRQLTGARRAGRSDDAVAHLMHAYHHGASTGVDRGWLSGVGDLARAAAAVPCRVIAYHPPIPIGYAEKMLGPQVTASNRANAAEVARVFHDACPGAIMLDTAFLCDDADFIDVTDATEHLNERGRAKLVTRIAQACSDEEAGGNDDPQSSNGRRA